MVAAVLASVLLGLTRAEIVARMRAPVITQADGLVQVYAYCAEDQRREYQTPIARFAAETVGQLYRGLGRRPVHVRQAGIVIHIGDVRTNVADVVVRVTTNDSRVVSRLYVRSPGYADLRRLRLEVVKAFYRCVEQRELSDAEAVVAYRRADPALRVADERQRLETWLATGRGLDDEEGLKMMRRIFEPGKASARDVLIFASRLFLYPPGYDLRFLGRFHGLSFSEALAYARLDPTIRIMAALKARELPVFGGGRGDAMSAAADAYQAFLLALAAGEKDDRELRAMLDEADIKLNVAMEESRRLSRARGDGER